MFYNVLKTLVKGFMYLYFRLRVYGRENFPENGAAVVVLNHRSYWDVPLCASVLPRKLHFMAKKELFSKPVLGFIIKWAGAFPVSRGTADLAAIKTSLSILKQEKCLAIFPEGRRVKKNEDHEVKAGAALIASKMNAPVVPVAIAGKYGFLRKIKIYIGKPVYITGKDGAKPTKQELEAYSQNIMTDVLRLAGESE